MESSQETGLRKDMGSIRRVLIQQFLVESIVMGLLAFVLAPASPV